MNQNRAPIYEALEQFRKNKVVPFDVPGHKRGRGNPELVQLLGKQCVELDERFKTGNISDQIAVDILLCTL